MALYIFDRLRCDIQMKLHTLYSIFTTALATYSAEEESWSVRKKATTLGTERDRLQWNWVEMDRFNFYSHYSRSSLLLSHKRSNFSSVHRHWTFSLTLMRTNLYFFFLLCWCCWALGRREKIFLIEINDNKFIYCICTFQLSCLHSWWLWYFSDLKDISLKIVVVAQSSDFLDLTSWWLCDISSSNELNIFDFCHKI